MKQFSAVVRVIVVALAVLAGTLAPAVASPAQAATVSLTELKTRALYYQRVNDLANRQASVDSITAASPWQGQLWTEFLARWDAANRNIKINTEVPADLPAEGHVFVVLGSALKATGAISAKLERRLQVAMKALAAYPNSSVLVTGGAPKNGFTEGQVMHDWLVAAGVPESRILVESSASSTISNATRSMAILLANPQFTSYTLISDASHIRRASVLFDAAATAIQSRTGAAWPMTALANVAYSDKAITAKASDATHSTITSNVASVFGVLSGYNALLKTPPGTPVLKSIKVTKPTLLKYAVGQPMDSTGLVVTAYYNITGLTKVVTPSAKVTGFSSTKTGKRTVTVTYTEKGVTKSASFTTTIAKAASGIELAASKTTLKVKKTQATITAKVVSATGVVPTGKVKFYLAKKLLKTVKLKASTTVVKLKYPKIKKTGTHKVTVKYLGDSRLEKSQKTLKVKVKK